MRILHLSHGGLPDWRIEKSAITASKIGHDVVFAGATNLINYKTNTFSKIYRINWMEGAKYKIPFYWHSVKRQVEKILKEIKPDLVHAHNIFSAKIISEFGLPFVYDDHEYWPVYARGLAESVRLDKMRNLNTNNNTYFRQDITMSSIRRRLASKAVWNLIKYRAVRLWTSWEKQLVSDNPTIVTTDRVARELRAMSNNDKVFVVPNFPMALENKDAHMPRFHSKLSSVYAGAESLFNSASVLSHRNMDGLAEIFINNNIGDLTMIGVNGKSSAKVKYMSFLSRQAMYDEMSNHSIGLLSFKKHWSHAYKSPNKAYEYPHAGLLVICTSSFKSVIETLKDNCVIFEDYNDLATRLEYFKDNLEEVYNKRLKIFEFTRLIFGVLLSCLFL